MTLAVVLIAAYLLGSFPTSYVVVYLFTGRDIRSMGSGNPGTMNVLDSVGFRAALLAGVGDIAKGAAAVALAYVAGLDDIGALMAAGAAIIGHDYSIFLRLDGGHGSATLIGALLLLLPWPTWIAGISGIVIGLAIGNRRVGGLIAIVMLPVLAFALDSPPVRTYAAMGFVTFTMLRIVRAEGVSLSAVRTRDRD